MAINFDDLGIDREIVTVDKDFCLGLGYGYRSEERSIPRAESLYASAANFRRAGAHALLLGDADIFTGAFREAQTMYGLLFEPYGLIMSAFVSDGKYPNFSFPTMDSEVYSPYGAMAYAVLTEAALGKAAPPGHRQRHLPAVPFAEQLGVLGLPSSAYLNLAAALKEDASNNLRLIARSILPFVSAFDLALTQARQNAYHWQRVALPFHPAEPDILGVVILVEICLRRRSESVRSILEMIPISSLAAEIIFHTLQLRFPPDALRRSEPFL
jgi:hypothetical protein